jgi:hypothetical protein
MMLALCLRISVDDIGTSYQIVRAMAKPHPHAEDRDRVLCSHGVAPIQASWSAMSTR